jgi:hypothetical protein
MFILASAGGSSVPSACPSPSVTRVLVPPHWASYPVLEAGGASSEALDNSLAGRVRSSRGRDRSNHLRDPLSGGSRVLVLPDPHRQPPSLAKESIRLFVPAAVSTDFRPPVGRVRPRRRGVFRATMPVAAIDEDGDLGTREDEVSPAVEIGKRSSIDAVTEAERMRRTPYSQLWLGVPSPVALHRCPARRRGRPRYVGSAHNSILAPRRAGARLARCAPAVQARRPPLRLWRWRPHERDRPTC